MDSLDKYLNHVDEPQDTSVNQSVSSVLGAWQNLQIILGQQVQRYIQSVNTKNSNNRRGVSISDINGLLAFLEETINNTLSASLKQQISISKLKTKANNKTINENKTMNKKQTIRLNESQLKRIVSESVKQFLNELDWKTYANAQHSALQRRKGDRPLSKAKLRKQEKSPYEAWNDITYADRKFRDAKVKAFNDTRKGAKMVKRRDQGPNPTDYDYLETPVGPFYGNGYDNQDNNDTRYKHKPDFLYTGADKRASEDTLNDTQEFSDYLQGNYTYDDEKGWHLKESKKKHLKNNG